MGMVLSRPESDLPPGAWPPSALYPEGKMGPPSGPSYIQIQKPSGNVDWLGALRKPEQKPQEQGKNVGLGEAGKGGLAGEWAIQEPGSG